MKQFAPHIILQLLALCLLPGIIAAQQSTFNLIYDHAQGIDVAYFAVEAPNSTDHFITAKARTGTIDSLIVFRVNDTGKIVSAFTFSEQGYYWFPENILINDSSSIVIVGTIYDPATFNYEPFLLWLDTSFNSYLIKYYTHGTGLQGGKKVKQTIDGGYIIAAFSQTFPNNDAQNYIFKIDRTGSKEWELIHGDTMRNEISYDVLQLVDSSYLFLSKRVYPSNDNILLLKVSADGKLVWEKELMTPYIRIGSVIIPVNDSIILIAGQGRTDFNPGKAFVECMDTAGNSKWVKFYTPGRGTFFHGDKANDSTYVFAGAIYRSFEKWDGFVAAIRPNGDLIWDRIISPYGQDNDPSNDYFYGVLATSDGGFLCTGFTGTGPISGTQDAWIMKLDSNGLCDTPTCFPWLVSVAPRPEKALLHLWPNPATDVVHLNLPQPTGTLTLTNMAGKAVLRQPVHTATEQLSLHGLPPGLYVVQWIREGEAPVTGKVMVVE